MTNGVITNWLGLGDSAGWLVRIDQPGACELKLVYSSNAASPGRYRVTFGNDRFGRPADKTGGTENFKTTTVGTTSFSKPGLYRLWIRPVEIPAGSQVMRVKEASIARSGN